MRTVTVWCEVCDIGNAREHVGGLHCVEIPQRGDIVRVRHYEDGVGSSVSHWVVRDREHQDTADGVVTIVLYCDRSKLD